MKLKATAIKKKVEPKRSTTSNEKENLICYKIQKKKKIKIKFSFIDVLIRKKFLQNIYNKIFLKINTYAG